MTACPISSPGLWNRVTNEILVALSPAHSCQPWLVFCLPVEHSPLGGFLASCNLSIPTGALDPDSFLLPLPSLRIV